MENKNTLRFHSSFTVSEDSKAADFLVDNCHLSKGKIKKVLQNGGVWLRRFKNKERRIRKATFPLISGDKIDCYYDESILAIKPPVPKLIADEQHYSIWYKPALLLSQGTRYGDHCSLLRLVAKYYNNKKDIKLVHRLDREAFGILLLAHDRKGAAAFSHLFQSGNIEKRYRAEVIGDMGKINSSFSFTSPLDGKAAKTTGTVLCRSTNCSTTKIDILLHSGRYHQIRRHLSQAGYPIVGDRRYGKEQTSSADGLRLCSYKLAFVCPITGQSKKFIMNSF